MAEMKNRWTPLAAAVLVLAAPLQGHAWQAQAATGATESAFDGRWEGVGLIDDSPVRLPSLVDFEFRTKPDGSLVVVDHTLPGGTEFPVNDDGRNVNFSLSIPVSPQRSSSTQVTATLSADGRSLEVITRSVGLSGKIEDVRKAVLTRDDAAARAFRYARIDAQGNPVTTYDYRAPADAGGPFATTTPEAAGLDRGKLEEMVRSILAEKRESRTESVLVLCDGKLVLAEYFWGNGPGDAHQTWSAVKSMTAIVAGIAWDQDAFELDATLLSYLPDYVESTLWGRENLAVSVRQILSMTSGAAIPHPQAMTTSPDMVAFMLDQPLEHPPALHYAYDNGLPVLAGQLVAHTTGQPFDRFAEDHLFTPLGIDDVRWTYLADGSPNAAGGFFVTPLDMARIGQMMLDEGAWRGKRIVSAEWVAESTRRQTAKGDYAYGFYWHLNDEAHGRFQGAEGYLALGALGQMIAVLPDERIVVVVTSTNTEPTKLLDQYIVPAIDVAEAAD